MKFKLESEKGGEEKEAMLKKKKILSSNSNENKCSISRSHLSPTVQVPTIARKQKQQGRETDNESFKGIYANKYFEQGYINPKPPVF